jgi:hypothetical protein
MALAVQICCSQLEALHTGSPGIQRQRVSMWTYVLQQRAQMEAEQLSVLAMELPRPPLRQRRGRPSKGLVKSAPSQLSVVHDMQ